MLKFLFFHKASVFLTISNHDNTLIMKEEINQLIAQGFHCLLHDYIEAENENSAKIQYLNDFIFSGTNGTIVAIHLPTGTEVWQKRVSNTQIQILCYHDILICNSNDTLFSLNALTGEELWSNPLRQELTLFEIAKHQGSHLPPRVIIQLHNNTLICSSREYFFALDPLTGKQLWRYKSPQTGISPSYISIPYTNRLLINSSKEGI